MENFTTFQQEIQMENLAKWKKNLEAESEFNKLRAAYCHLQTDIENTVKELHVLKRKQDLICKPPDVLRVA